MDCEKIYQQALEPLLQKAEPQRRALWQTTKRWALLGALGGGLLGALLGIGVFGQWLVPTLFLAAGSGLAGYFWQQHQAKPFLQKTEKQCMEALLEAMDLQGQYLAEQGLPENAFFSAELVHDRIDRVRSRKLVEAQTPDGVAFRLCWVRAKKKVRERASGSSGNTRTKLKTVYNGLLGQASLPQDAGFQLFLRAEDPDASFDKTASKQERMGQMLQKARSLAQSLMMAWNPKRVRGADLMTMPNDDPEFRRYYHAYSDQPEALRQTLSAEDLRPILDLNHRGTQYENQEEFTQSLMKGGQPPDMRQPYLQVALRGDTLYWGRLLNKEGWLPLELKKSFLRPEDWQKVIFDLDDARQLTSWAQPMANKKTPGANAQGSRE